MERAPGSFRRSKTTRSVSVDTSRTLARIFIFLCFVHIEGARPYIAASAASGAGRAAGAGASAAAASPRGRVLAGDVAAIISDSVLLSIPLKYKFQLMSSDESCFDDRL